MGSRKYTPKQIKNVVKDYKREDLTAQEVANKWGMNIHSVYYYVHHANGVRKDNKTFYKKPGWAKKQIPVNTVERIIKDRSNGLSVKAIANKYGVCPATIYKYVKIAKKRQALSWTEFLSQRFSLLSGRN